MSIVNIFGGSYCHDEEITARLVQRLGYEYMDEEQLIAETEKRYAVPAKKLFRALYHEQSVFNSFTHEKERCIAYLKMVLAESIMKENLVYSGFLGYVVPGAISHVLKVCIIADIDYRVNQAVTKSGLSEKDALKAIKKYDEERTKWSQYLFELSPWDASLYDMVIPVDKTSTDSAVGLIEENVKSDVLQVTPDSKRAAADFILAA
ncbi:MAG TPA: cytidylate kinase-like family protein [Thermodesulfovibrionia bacterium]|nr:cytidylate kinase-like family protein [Thermodesulfovibrionia bacterium]